MNPICNFCKHQEPGPIWSGRVRCGKAQYRSSDGYGPFKSGCSCIYDADLENSFAPREEGDGTVARISKLLADQEKQISEMRYTIATLQDRLTKI